MIKNKLTQFNFRESKQLLLNQKLAAIFKLTNCIQFQLNISYRQNIIEKQIKLQLLINYFLIL